MSAAAAPKRKSNTIDEIALWWKTPDNVASLFESGELIADSTNGQIKIVSVNAPVRIKGRPPELPFTFVIKQMNAELDSNVLKALNENLQNHSVVNRPISWLATKNVLKENYIKTARYN